MVFRKFSKNELDISVVPRFQQFFVCCPTSYIFLYLNKRLVTSLRGKSIILASSLKAG